MLRRCRRTVFKQVQEDCKSCNFGISLPAAGRRAFIIFIVKIARLSFLPSWTLSAILLGLLAVLATLQHRWLGEVSEAQRERTRSRLDRDARLFAKDFDRELTRIFGYAQVIRDEALARGFRSAPEASDVAAFYELWEDVAPHPDFLRDVLLVERDGSGAPRLARFDPEAGELRAVGWDGELARLRDRLGEVFAGPGPPAPGDFLVSQTPAVVVPLLAGPIGRRRGPDRREALRSQHIALVVFRLEPSKLLAALAVEHFGDGDGLEVSLRVVDRDDGRIVFETGPGSGEAPPAGAGDATSELFGLLSAEESRSLKADLPLEPRFHRGRHYADLFWNAFSQTERRWRLVVTHPSGSLDRAVAATRRRNLALGLGILLVLATTVLMLLRATRRSQKLARQQIEFVAGVTHELRTPLAALRSAGENLADGVVREPSQVARYGTMIEREGRRLSDMVEQVLEYAGIQSGRRAWIQEPTAVAELVAAALAESRPQADGIEVETEIREGLPEVMADPPALRRALGNLIGNAVKYGKAGGYLAVRAEQAGQEVRISVADRGRGIPEEDLPHIFEPFYRGRRLAGGSIAGSGLGLSLVRQIAEAHGGRVTVASREGEGSTFTLHLPAAPRGGRESVRAETCEA